MFHYLLIYFAFQLAIIGGAITVSRWRRSKRLRHTSMAPPDGFIKTEEVFVDPTTQIMQRVWYHPQSGERYYETVGSNMEKKPLESNQVFAETNRLVLRYFCLQDLDSFYKYRSNQEVAKFQSWENYQYHEAESFVHEQMTHSPNQPGTWFQFAIADRETNQLIGDCALHTLLDEPRIVEIGVTLSPEQQGKGYASEALSALFNYLFDKLNKHKVIAFSDVRNEKSIRVLERIGMRREGHLLQNYMAKGQWVDEYQYAILKSEWIVK